MPNILEISNLTKTFSRAATLMEIAASLFKNRRSIIALDNVSFSLEKGKILGLLGPNGCGKTTLLKIIATLILPDKGQIAFYPASEYQAQSARSIIWTSSGISKAANEEKVKSSLGLLLEEERSFYVRLTGRQNLEFFAALHDLEHTEIQKRIEELFRLFDIDYGDERFDTYSTGMKHRFSLMRTFLPDPPLLLLDEPAKSLDYLTTQKLKDYIIQKLVRDKGRTVILTTHDLNASLDFCDTFLFLKNGQLCGQGTLTRLQHDLAMAQASIKDIFVKLMVGD